MAMLAALMCCSVVFAATPSMPAHVTQQTHVDLQNRLGDLEVHRQTDGTFKISVPGARGKRTVSPDQFAALVYRGQEQMRSHGLLFVVFNITGWEGVVWVSVGLFGQVLFTARMVIQWLASEKERRSVVPVAFWWASLVGGLMLLIYFVWRKDIVGVLGQSTGVFIYLRNLYLIYLTHPRGPVASDAQDNATSRVAS